MEYQPPRYHLRHRRTLLTPPEFRVDRTTVEWIHRILDTNDIDNKKILEARNLTFERLDSHQNKIKPPSVFSAPIGKRERAGPSTQCHDTRLLPAQAFPAGGRHMSMTEAYLGFGQSWGTDGY